MRCVSRTAIGGPPSITWPTPLNTRPRIEGDSPNVSGSPRKRTTVSASASPDVDSSTSIVMNASSIAAMRPSRAWPSRPVISTASCRPTSSVRRRKSIGPSSRAAAPSTVSLMWGLSGAWRSPANSRSRLASRSARRASCASPMSSAIRCSGRSDAISLTRSGVTPAATAASAWSMNFASSRIIAACRAGEHTRSTSENADCRRNASLTISAQKSVICWRTGSASLPMMRAIRSRRACSSSSVRKRRRSAHHWSLPCAAHHGANSRASSAYDSSGCTAG